MKAKFTFPIEYLVNKTAGALGHVAFNWRGINVLRKYVIPRNPQSTDQVAIRTIMTQGSQGFKTMSAEQKAAWSVYASGKKISVFGKDVQLPEIAIFDRINSWRQIDGQAISLDPPSALCDFSASNIATFAYNSGTKVLSFVVTHNATTVTNKMWEIQITPALPSGVRNPTKSIYRLAKGVTTDSIIPVTASPQTVQITEPVFTYAPDGCYMSIRLTPLSPDYDNGTVLEKKSMVAVT